MAWRCTVLQAERIGVDHVAKVKATSTATAASEVTEHLGSQHSAVDMLYQRIKIIRQCVRVRAHAHAHERQPTVLPALPALAACPGTCPCQGV